MELKETYLRTLEKVLLRLSATKREDPKLLTEEVKSMCCENWVSVRNYIKTHNAYSFVSGLLWQPHRENLAKCLTEVRLELDGLRQQKAAPRKEMGRQIIIQVISGLIISAISFIAGVLYERHWSSEINTDKKTEHSEYQIGKDSVGYQPSLDIR